LVLSDGSNRSALRATAKRGLVIVVLFCSIVAAHNIPSQLPEPLSSEEAWNVLHGSASNIDTLLDASLLRDITFQIANSDGSLRYLGAHSNREKVRDLTKQLLADGSDLIAAIRDQKTPIEKIQSQWWGRRSSARSR
jgi:hypothetical protein